MKRLMATAAALVLVAGLSATAGAASSGQGKALGKQKNAKPAPALQASGKAHGLGKASAPGHSQAGGAEARAGAQKEHGSENEGAAVTARSSHPNPGCRGAVFTTDEGDTMQNKNKYTVGEDVYLRGYNFDEGVDLSYTVVKVNSGHAKMTSGSIGAPDAGGAFLAPVWLDPAATGHEYQAIVTWEVTLPNGTVKTCRKSDNFFFVGAEEAQGGGASGGGASGGGQGGAGTGSSGDAAGASGKGSVEATGVLGAQASGESGGSGVLGAVAGAELPFTGLPLWIPLLAGAALVAGGLALRRRQPAAA